jgi:hypothetical protein
MMTEPTTLLTDYALSGLTAWLALRLRQLARATKQRAVRICAFAFAATAFGGLAGGTYHGFSTALDPRLSAVLWTVTTIAVGLGACLLLSAALVASVRSDTRRWLLRLLWAQFAGYALWMLAHDDFLYVIAEYGGALVLTALVQIASPTARQSSSSGWIVAGVAASIAGAVIQQSGIDLHPRFNHNDLQHVVQMVAVVFLYKGGSRLKDQR